MKKFIIIFLFVSSLFYRCSGQSTLGTTIYFSDTASLTTGLAYRDLIDTFLIPSNIQYLTIEKFYPTFKVITTTNNLTVTTASYIMLSDSLSTAYGVTPLCYYSYFVITGYTSYFSSGIEINKQYFSFVNHNKIIIKCRFWLGSAVFPANLKINYSYIIKCTYR
jgi:hypothetical protein